ncbi:uncharacterized protein TNIN_367751 [Trichonephila inaurata madagascariensis]|uniref:Uncharacterized protein n=1 Tax=Trichonephila inaurata madagascariensis TaxID=2747483 RepID=A0A8X7BPG3_9ARAC|nr:uncharacterized protein TNIN_367751 [Trichonephila inaurata madagascariensis]
MTEERSTVQEASGKMNLINEENMDEFDYSKISDETDAIIDYLDRLTEEVIKMRECAVANIELVSKINNIDFERKIEELEKLFEEYSKSQETTHEISHQN